MPGSARYEYRLRGVRSSKSFRTGVDLFPQSRLPRGFFVTGTDTGVGKTLIACSLLYGLKAKGKHAIGMKPIASGCVETADGLLSEDALALTAASSRQLAIREVNPYAFVPAIAPHVAANAAGLTIEIDRIVESFGAVAARCDIVVVEGVGGFRVPLNEREDTADLAVRLQLPIVLVVGMRLGCLNHALLTVEAIGARGLTLAGWVANGIDAKMQMFEENVASLRQRISSPCLGVIAFDPQVSASTARGERFCETLLKPMGVC